MSVQLKLNQFELDEDGENVRLSADVSAQPPESHHVVYLYVAVGAEEPIKIARGYGPTNGTIDATVPIGKTVRAVGRHHGRKPVTVTAYGCWAHDEPQALAWIEANCAESTRADEVLYLNTPMLMF